MIKKILPRGFAILFLLPEPLFSLEESVDGKHVHRIPASVGFPALLSGLLLNRSDFFFCPLFVDRPTFREDSIPVDGK